VKGGSRAVQGEGVGVGGRWDSREKKDCVESEFVGVEDEGVWFRERGGGEGREAGEGGGG